MRAPGEVIYHEAQEARMVGSAGTVLGGSGDDSRPSGRMAVVAVDPGGTTGLAVYDAIGGKLWWDQLDAGLGMHVRHFEDPQRLSANLRGLRKAAVDQGRISRRTARTGGMGGGGGLRADPLLFAQVEYGVSQHICDIIQACGPIGTLVIEDFVLGAKSGGKGGYGQRMGLSPVRVTSGILSLAQARGLLSGVAWEVWKDHGFASIDGRGIMLRGDGGQYEYWSSLGFDARVRAVREWRLKEGIGGLVGRGWLGEGWRVVLQMPGTAKGVATDERMRRWNLWVTGKPHATDALRHMVLFMRQQGMAFPLEMDRGTGINDHFLRNS